MDACSPVSSVDPMTLEGSEDHSYPTPPHMSDDSVGSPSPSLDDQPKKKRKAWGQPVPEIKAILPPRKRAKTAEEKEQRKNERILRNRRAADKSRQRQKAAVAELEAKQTMIEEEVASLRDLLSRYQDRFGVPNDFPSCPPQTISIDEAVLKHLPSTKPSISSLDTSVLEKSKQPTLETIPEFTQPTPLPSVKHESPVLAPTLNLIDTVSPSESIDSMTTFDNFVPNVSGLTQYPAVILCDLQCQPQTLDTKLSWYSSPSFNIGLHTLLRLIQALTILETSSATTLSTLNQLFQIMAQRLSTMSMERDFLTILDNFPLIHSLISMPSTPTRPAVFRMKLLSRLLACSPHMARLLLAATDRALQRVVGDEDFAEDSDRSWTWSSLMTIKWAIVRLEREHWKIRHQVRTDPVVASTNNQGVMDGVDYGAVARNVWLWNGPDVNCINSEDNMVMVPEVH